MADVPGVPKETSKSKAKYDAEEESSSRRRRKKKKDGEEGEDDYGGRSWRAKGEDEWEEKPSRKSRHKEAEWWESDERPSRKSWDDEDRGSKKRWQEAETSSQSKWPEEEKPSKKKSGKGGEEGKGSRWRAKDEPKAAEEEEWGGEKSSKPRKGRKGRRGGRGEVAVETKEDVGMCNGSPSLLEGRPHEGPAECAPAPSARWQWGLHHQEKRGEQRSARMIQPLHQEVVECMA